MESLEINMKSAGIPSVFTQTRPLSLLREAIPRSASSLTLLPRKLPACRASLNQLSSIPTSSLPSLSSFPTASPYSLTSASSHYFSSFHLSQSHPLRARVPLPAHSLKSIMGALFPFPRIRFLSSLAETTNPTMPRYPVACWEIKSLLLRGGGAVHLLSDARCWKSGPS